MEAAAGYAVLQGGAQILGGLQGRQDALYRSAEAKSQAYLADTQALQRDTLARNDLAVSLAGIRAARAANGLSGTSPNARILEQETIKRSDRDRIIQVGDYRQNAANFRAAAKSYRRAGRLSLITGLVSGGVPLAQYHLNK